MDVDEAALDAFLQEGVTTPEPTEEASQTTPPVESTTPPVDDELPAGDTFDRKYVEQLRQESANYRLRAKKYQEAFDGYEDEAVQEWLQLATTLKADPRTAAQRFQEIAEAIQANYEAETGTPPADEVSDGQQFEADKPLTKAEFEQLWQAKQAEIEQNRLVREIESEATSLGYQKGTDQYDKLLWTATRLPSGSIAEAHEHIQRERQAIIDAYVKEMGGTSAPRIPDGKVGAPPAADSKFNNFEEANAKLDEWLAANAG